MELFVLLQIISIHLTSPKFIRIQNQIKIERFGGNSPKKSKKIGRIENPYGTL